MSEEYVSREERAVSWAPEQMGELMLKEYGFYLNVFLQASYEIGSTFDDHMIRQQLHLT